MFRPAAEMSSNRADEAPRNGRPTSRRSLLIVLGVTFAAAALVLAVFAVYQLATWPDVAALATSDPTTTAFIESYRKGADGKPAVRWTWVPYEGISDHLKRAVLVSEDLEFFSHNGFSTQEIGAALRDTLEEGKPLRGASTLTQQLAKNLWLTPSRNPWRKAKEAILTFQLEANLSKRRILELYLNVVELGPGVFGAEAAAQRYFGTSAAALSERQAAALAASLPRPSGWHPESGSTTASRRTERILGRMAEAGWLRELL